MVLSRSLAAPGGNGSVMVPFVDLLNHRLGNASVYMATHPDRISIVATRDIHPVSGRSFTETQIINCSLMFLVYFYRETVCKIIGFVVKKLWK